MFLYKKLIKANYELEQNFTTVNTIIQFPIVRSIAILWPAYILHSRSLWGSPFFADTLINLKIIQKYHTRKTFQLIFVLFLLDSTFQLHAIANWVTNNDYTNLLAKGILSGLCLMNFDSRMLALSSKILVFLHVSIFQVQLLDLDWIVFLNSVIYERVIIGWLSCITYARCDSLSPLDIQSNKVVAKHIADIAPSCNDIIDRSFFKVYKI